MLTQERMEEIYELVEAWDQDQRRTEKYPVDSVGLTDDLCNYTYFHRSEEPDLVRGAKRNILRAAHEMNIEFDELINWYKQHNQESDEDALHPDHFPPEE